MSASHTNCQGSASATWPTRDFTAMLPRFPTQVQIDSEDSGLQWSMALVTDMKLWPSVVIINYHPPHLFLDGGTPYLNNSAYNYSVIKMVLSPPTGYLTDYLTLVINVTVLQHIHSLSFAQHRHLHPSHSVLANPPRHTPSRPIIIRHRSPGFRRSRPR